MSWDNDKLAQMAKKENYVARSVYKLQEIETRERILKGVTVVIDLGASPGSWVQYLLRTTSAKIIAVDRNPIKIADPRVVFIQQPVETLDLKPYLGEKKADLLLSDLAPDTSGISDRDVALSQELVLWALKIADAHLKMGGTFIAKTFMGEGFEDLKKNIAKKFESLRILRPKATKKHSREVFFIAKNYRTLLSRLI